MCGIVTIISIFLFAFSFATVDILENGIVFDGNTQRIIFDKTYTNGRYFVGLGRSFIVYPSNLQSIRFGNFGWLIKEEEWEIEEDVRGEVEARSSDGMQLFLEVTFQFQLSSEPADLVRLYRDFGEEPTGYRQVYADMAEEVIRNVAAEFESTDFFTQRSAIQQNMQTELNEQLSRVYASVHSLQLINMEFDRRNRYASAIEATQVAAQQVQETRNELEVADVQAQAVVESANLTAQVLIATAQTDKETAIKQAEADAAALLYKTQAQVDGYNALRKHLNFTTTGELLSYLWFDAMANGAGKVVLNMQYPKSISNFLAENAVPSPGSG